MAQVEVGTNADNTVVIIQYTRPNGQTVSIPLTASEAHDIASNLLQGAARVAANRQFPTLILPPGG